MDIHYLGPMAMVLKEQATLTTQGQLTLPKRIRQVLKLHAGQSRVVFTIGKNGTVEVSRAPSPAKTIDNDPDLQPFLTLLAKDMRDRPQRIKPIRTALLKRARDLVRNVRVDLDGPLVGND